MVTPDIYPTFSDWWELYAYKLDRKRCERLWAKMTQADREKAMQHTERYILSTFTDGRYPSRRHPGTYLFNDNWHDEALVRTIETGSSPNDKKREVLEAILSRSQRSDPDHEQGHGPRSVNDTFHG